MFDIRMLNDDFRRTFLGGRVCMSQGVGCLPAEKIARIQSIVQSFDDFSEDNDPHGEHDFGSFTFDGDKFFFKIDYYDATCTHGSEDPSDPEKTTRVLTILRVDEW